MIARFRSGGAAGAACRAAALLCAAAVLLLPGPPFGGAYDGAILDHLVPEDALYKSPVHLVLNGDGTRLFAVCEKAHAVLVIDPDTREVLREIPVGRNPYAIAIHPDGGRIYVSNRWDDTVSVIDAGTLEVAGVIPTGADPHGLALDASGDTLYVANMQQDDVSLIDTASHREIKRLRAGNEPIEAASSPDGRFVFVTNLLTHPVPFRRPPVSEVTIIDTRSQIVVDRRFLPGANISQGVAVSPDGRLAVAAVEIPKNLIPETQIYQGWMVTYGVAVLDARPGGRAAVLLLDDMSRYYADPFGVAFSPDGACLYVSSSGVDSVSVLDVEGIRRILGITGGAITRNDAALERFARHLGLSHEFVTARIPTGANPKGMAVSPDGTRLYVADRLGDAVTVIDAAARKPLGAIDLGGPGSVTVVRRGEILFNRAAISFQQQLSCNTCHPENNVDCLIYDIAVDGGLGGNLVDNRTMRGVAHTGPFKWNGRNPTLRRQEGPRAAQLFFRSHGFTGKDRDAVVAFIETIPLYPNRRVGPGGELTDAQRRGKVIFERTATNDGGYIPIGNRCITCHPPPDYTCLRGADVGTRAYFDTEGSFDTPQLTGLAATAPYLHDGRCWSLEEIWTVYNPYDLHGAANDLTKQQLNDLIEYLKTL